MRAFRKDRRDELPQLVFAQSLKAVASAERVAAERRVGAAVSESGLQGSLGRFLSKGARRNAAATVERISSRLRFAIVELRLTQLFLHGYHSTSARSSAKAGARRRKSGISGKSASSASLNGTGGSGMGSCPSRELKAGRSGKRSISARSSSQRRSRAGNVASAIAAVVALAVFCKLFRADASRPSAATRSARASILNRCIVVPLICGSPRSGALERTRGRTVERRSWWRAPIQRLRVAGHWRRA
jgi:hypothetical protein